MDYIFILAILGMFLRMEHRMTRLEGLINGKIK